MDKEQLLKDAIEKYEGEIMTLQVMVRGLKTELSLGKYREQTPPILLNPESVKESKRVINSQNKTANSSSIAEDFFEPNREQTGSDIHTKIRKEMEK